jgi:diguanylate cyclase (GGDEF)-like protein
MNTQNQALELQIEQLKAEIAQLRTKAERDDLTGCLRRDAFVSMIEERRRFGWLEKNMTLAVVDIDHFKKVNDTHGHLSGDEALRVVAETLRKNAPEGSLLCRMGGEEFVILMPGTAAQNRTNLELLRKRIQTTPVRLRENLHLALTASFGAADWNTDDSLLLATAEADRLLYNAKKGGRNRVEITTNSDEDFAQAS